MSNAGIPCVIGRGVHVKGLVRGAEDVAVEGALEGRLELDHHLAVLAGGLVQGDVLVRSCACAGELKGSLDATDVVSLHEGAVVQADIKAPRVIIEDGVSFTGSIEMDVTLPEDM